MIYKYTGFDRGTKQKVKGKIEAQNLEDAKRRIKAKNILFQSIEEENPSIFQNIKFTRKRKMSSKDLANLSRDLSIYIRSGISIVNAIRLAKNQYEGNKRIALFLDSITTYLDEGKNFYNALESQNVFDIPNFYKQSIKVSENSGILDEVLIELSKLLKNQDRLNKQLQSSFAYPIFILSVSVIMVGFMMTYVVPKITSIFAQLDQELPLITKIVVTTGDWFQANWSTLGIALLIAIFTFTFLLNFNTKFRYMIDKIMLKLPFFGSIVESAELGRFAYISSILFRSGVPFVQTINLSAKILKNSVIRGVFERASAKVVEGGRLSTALLAEEVKINKSFVQAVTLGEETSEVSLILQNLSELYFEENKDKLTIFLSLLEPFLMLFVGGIIGLIVTAMLLPIFSMNIGG